MRGLATAWLLIAGAVWLVVLFAAIYEMFGTAAAVVWVLAAIAHGWREVEEMWDASKPPQRAWWVSFRWWLESFISPVFAVLRWVDRVGVAPRTAGPAAEQPPLRTQAPPPRTQAPPRAQAAVRTEAQIKELAGDDRLAVLERRVTMLEAEIVELRSHVAPGVVPAAEPAQQPEEPEAAPVPTMLDFVVEPVVRPTPAAPSPTPAVPVAAPTAAAQRVDQPSVMQPRVEPPAAPPPPPREPFLTPYLARIRSLDISDLMGARMLAWAGGVVTLLGIVFFFVLAANRGWIGPEIRVACGAVASALCFGAGIYLHRKYGQVYSSLTAAGAGIAGGYATLLAAAALYDLLPAVAALACAAGIAAVGAALALRWNAEPLAGLGLIGAMLVPAVVVLEGGLTPLGTGFVAVVFAATAYVAIERRWLVLLVLGILAGLPQVAALVAQDDAHGSAATAAVAVAFWLLYLATAVRWHARLSGHELEPGPASLVVTTSVLATSAAVTIFDGTAEGIAMLVVAAVEAALAVALYLRPRFRELAAVVGIGALTVLAISGAVLLSGSALASVWAFEAAALAWLAAFVRERRFQVASLAYLLLAAGHAVVIDDSLRALYVRSAHPGHAAVSAISVALAAAAVALFARDWEDRARSGGVLAPFDRFVADLGARQPLLRQVGIWFAGGFAVCAASLVLVGLDFDWGHTGMTALWSGLGLVLVAVGLRLQEPQIHVAGFVLLGAAVLELMVYDLPTLNTDQRSLSALAVGAAASLAGVLEQRLYRHPWQLDPTAVFALAVGVVATTGGTLGLGGAGWLFAPAAAYAALCALMLVRPDSRDLATVLGVPALVLAGVAAAEHLDGTWLVLVYAAAAAGLAGAASVLREPRFRLAGIGFTAVTVGHVLAFDARPDGLFVEHDPAGGIAAVVLSGLGVLLLGLELRRRYATRPDDAVRNEAYTRTAQDLEELVAPATLAALWLAGVAAVYASSLALLSIDFEAAQPAVSGLWAVVGLACVASLAWRPVLRIGGFAFLLAAAVKVLAYDVGHLDTTGRAVSLIVVGGVWALAGFADQRLERRGALDWPSMSLLVAGAAFVAAGTVDWGGEGWLLAPAGAFAVLWGLAFLREDERDFAGLTAAISLLFAGVAAAALLDGTWLVLAWTGAAAALAGVSAATHEPRFRAGAIAFLALGVGHAIAFDARLDRLFSASEHPGSGAPALLAVVVAAVVVARELARTEGYRSVPAAVAGHASRASKAGIYGAGILAVYALSLSILELAERVAPGTVHENFQAGHTGVSACWGLVGLGMLYVGLRRRSTGLRLGGFAVLGVSLAKIFLYDLANLSSVARALSFLAVGAVLLAGGLLYQRLAGESERPAT